MADTLKELRAGRGLTQIQLAEAVGVTSRTIQAWENAERGLPSKRLATLSRELDSDPATLLRAWAEMDSVDAQEIPE